MPKAKSDKPLMVITGARKGIGRFLAQRYAGQGWQVAGCSREPAEALDGYRHFCLDVADEAAVMAMFSHLRADYGRLDVLVNNAGIASMNHCVLTPMRTVQRIMSTNFAGTFLFCREAAKLMAGEKWGRIVNFATVATPLQLEGEAVYAASKAAVVSLTQILARELAAMGVTVNAVGPTPVKTDLIRSVPEAKIEALLARQAIGRLGEFADVANVIDFFIARQSDFVTGQTVYLGGIS